LSRLVRARNRKMTKTQILWATCIIMALAAAVFIAIGYGRRTRNEEDHWVAHLAVPILASLSYLAMANGQSVLTLPGGRDFYLARFLD
jgi:bacteriorhodopsin